MSKNTHFGFETISEDKKSERVAEVFASVASRYDLMNDLMSLGLHRVWKRFTIEISGVRRGERVLDIAGGTGDLSLQFARRVGPQGSVLLTDINASMLKRGRDRLLDSGISVTAIQCDAENLPFPASQFDCVCVAFGLRNMTHKDTALKEMFRVLRPGGRLLVLEFSKIWKVLQPLYETYSFKVLPLMGQWVAKDADSYRYLAESIRVHPDQDEIKEMMSESGFEGVEYLNLSAGVVALHRGYKF